jgi:hypothetical protein
MTTCGAMNFITPSMMKNAIARPLKIRPTQIDFVVRPAIAGIE